MVNNCKVTMVGKNVILADIADKLGLKHKKDAVPMLAAVLESIKDHLAEGEGVRLIPFGSFEIRTRKARPGRNPSTKEVIQIPERKVAAFKPGKELKDAVK